MRGLHKLSTDIYYSDYSDNTMESDKQFDEQAQADHQMALDLDQELDAPIKKGIGSMMLHSTPNVYQFTNNSRKIGI